MKIIVLRNDPAQTLITFTSVARPHFSMKITDLEVFVVGNPPPGYGGRYFIFVKLTTDSGVTGLGEIYSVPFMPHVVEQMTRDVFERHILGREASDIERMWRSVYGSGYLMRPDASLIGILSGIEIACWDIMGKEAGKPVAELLGGIVRPRLRSYTYLYPRLEDGPTGDAARVYNDPDAAAECAAAYVKEGFTAVKFDPAGPYTVYDPYQLSLEALDRSEAFCKAIREAVGDKADLLFGTHGQMVPSSAIRLAKRLEKYDPLWLEEPTGAEMPEEMAKIAAATSIPVATGERLVTKYEFARVLRTGAASILQMALGRVGGIWEAKKIAAMAETHYAQIAPHLYCGPVEGAANIHFAASIPNFLILESIQQWQGFHSEILTTPISWEDGYVNVPSEPGLGIELNEDVCRANPYTGDKLHLELWPDPPEYPGER